MFLDCWQRMRCLTGPTDKQETASAALTVIAVMMFVLSMITRYELGLLKLIPMKAHLAIDVLTGLTIAAAPFLFARNADTGEIGLAAALGVFEVLAALMTESEASVERSVSAYR